jgi:hypothetical protein
MTLRPTINSESFTCKFVTYICYRKKRMVFREILGEPLFSLAFIEFRLKILKMKNNSIGIIFSFPVISAQCRAYI